MEPHTSQVITLPRKSDNPYVARSECAQISGQVRNELKVLKVALVGEDMRGGISRELGEMKIDLKDVKEYINNQKAKGRDWRLLGFAILGSVVSGVVVGIITSLL